MLKYRLIFGPLMIAALLLLFYLDNRLDRVELRGFWQDLFLGREHLPAGLLMLLGFLVLIVLGAREMTGIFRAKGIEADTSMVVLSGLAGCTLIYALPHWLESQDTMAIVATVITALFVATTIKYSWLHKRTQGAVAVAAVTMLALVYMGLLPGFYIAIRRWHSAWVVMAILLVTKACDIGAYATGRSIGRHKLIPWLSPGKTWEGLAGGVLLSALVAVGLAALSNAVGASEVHDIEAGQRVLREFRYPLGLTFVAGAVIGLVGQFGDLTASLFKRDAGLKDSGASIPGFGGLIDVVDSPIVVAPVAYWLLRLLAWAGDHHPAP